MNDSANGERDAVVMQVEALRNENNQLKQQLGAIQAQRAAEQQQFAMQYQAAASGVPMPHPPSGKSFLVVPLVVALALFVLGLAGAVVFMVAAPSPPSGYPTQVG